MCYTVNLVLEEIQAHWELLKQKHSMCILAVQKKNLVVVMNSNASLEPQLVQGMNTLQRAMVL